MIPARDLRPYAARLALSWHARFGEARCVELPGTLLKVDVSGFTRLSERLGRTERTGAEEVNAVIDGLWTELISPVLALGGDVLQFGGDALAVWFEGEQHQVRAAQAAAGMHRTVRARPAELTPAGKVKLRMSAGAQSGVFGVGLVGASHQELVLMGPATSAALRRETLAEPGQTLVDEALAVALERAGGSVTRGGHGPRLRRAPPDRALASVTDTDGDASAFLDPRVLELEEAGIPLGEHRRVSVAFLHLGGLDATVAEHGVLAAHAQVAAVAGAVEEQVARHDVCWLATDLAGDGVVFLLVSGAPRASEDDEERLLRVVRDVIDATRPMPVRAGIHAGRAFAGDVGHPQRRTFAVLGDTTNTAARLMGSAAPGQVRVSEEVYARSARDHEVEWSGELSLKGRQQVIRAGLLGARTGAPLLVTHNLALHGRETERADLDQRLKQVRAGDPGSAVVLHGPAGLGKSRLSRHVHESAGIPTLLLRAEPYESASPFHAARAPLRSILGLTGTADATRLQELCGDDADLAPLLGLPLGLELPATSRTEALDPAFVPQRRVDLLVDLLLRQAEPLLVVAEDLQHLDRASLDLLDALATRTTTASLLVLCTSRALPDGWPKDPSVWSALELGPLDDAPARDLALAFAGDAPLDDLQLERVLREAAGNPLFLRELVLWATQEGADDVPEGVEQVIAARIDRLPAADRALLRQAAVLGALVDPALAADVLGNRDLAHRRAWGRLQQFLQEEVTGLRFRQDLYRRVAYQGLSVRRRRAIHRETAQWLARRAGTDLGSLAQHLYAAQQWPEAFTSARLAALAARDDGALGDAQALAEAALEAGRRSGADASALADVDDLLGDVADLLGRYAVADRAYARSARVGDPDTRLQRLVKRAAVVERQGRYRLALSLLTRAERASPAPHLLRAALLRRSSTLFRCGRLLESRDAARRVVDLASEDALDRARALLRLEMIASDRGDPERFDLGRQAVAAFEGIDEPRELGNLYVNLGVTAWESDDWVAAVEHYSASEAAYLRAGDRVGAAIAVNNAAEILVDQGHLEQARRRFEEARRVFRASGHLLGATATDSALARIVARSGQVEQAREQLLAVWERFLVLGSASMAADARVRLVEVALLAGDADAVEQARHCAEDPDVIGGGTVLPLTARRYVGVAHALAGDTDDAVAVLRACLSEARSTRSLHEVGSCLDHLVRLGAADDAETSELSAVWRRLGVVSVPGYALG